MAKEILLDIKVDANGATETVNSLGGAVDKLGAKVDKAAANTNKSVKAFVKLKDGIKALAGATIVLKAFDIAAETFQSLDVVARKVEQAFALVKATLMSLVHVVENFGKSAWALLTGEFKDAATYASIFTTQIQNLPKVIKQTASAALDSVDALRAWRDAERELNIEVARRQALIEKNKYISEDEKRTIDERLEAAKTAYALESEIARERIKLEQEKIDIIMKDPTMDKKAAATQNELAEAKIKILEAQNDMYSRQTELNNKINQLEKERLIIDKEFRVQSIDFTQQAEEKKLEIKERLRQEDLDNERKYMKDMFRINQQNEFQTFQMRVALGQQTASALFDIAHTVTDATAKNAQKQFKINKALSLSEAIVNTALGTTVALRDPSTSDPITKALYVASVAASGAAAIARISATKYQSTSTTFEAPTFNPVLPEAQQTANAISNQINQQPVQAYVTATDVSNALEARKFLQNRNKL